MGIACFFLCACFAFFQRLHDWKLVLAVLVLGLVDLVILAVYTIVEGIRGNLGAEKIENEENLTDVKGVSTLHVV